MPGELSTAPALRATQLPIGPWVYRGFFPPLPLAIGLWLLLDRCMLHEPSWKGGCTNKSSTASSPALALPVLQLRTSQSHNTSAVLQIISPSAHYDRSPALPRPLSAVGALPVRRSRQRSSTAPLPEDSSSVVTLSAVVSIGQSQ